MKDYRKFCRPKTTKHPKVGDVQVKLNCGSTVYVKAKDYLSIKKSFKINSVVGETTNTAGNVRVLDKELNKEITVSPETYASNLNKFELVEIVGNRYEDPTNGHDYVEIGGLKWATMNIGASNITDKGLYFLWGDTQGYTIEQVGTGADKKLFNWITYKYSDGNGGSTPVVNKYNTSDNKNVLDLSDDAAATYWKGSWRMPTKDEFETLINSTNVVWTDNYQDTGVSGAIRTDKTDSSKELFFPVTGNCFDTAYQLINSHGFYWTSSRLSDSNISAYYYMAFIYSLSFVSGHDKSIGFNIRSVFDTPLPPENAVIAQEGDIICHNTTLNQDAIFSYNDWLNLNDSWDLVGLYGITTYKEEDAENGDYIIMANGHTLIIKSTDYSKVSDHWEHVDTIASQYDYAGHEYVDLGLPSGTKWATMNVGASSETDYGNYYQYGKGADDISITSGQSGYSGTENPLAASADTATQVWGGSWHMPTSVQCQELIDNTTYEWVVNFNGSGVNGATFTANGKTLFIPAAGDFDNDEFYDENENVYIRTCTPYSQFESYALGIDVFGPNVDYTWGNNWGMSVRPVVG